MNVFDVNDLTEVNKYMHNCFTWVGHDIIIILE